MERFRLTGRLADPRMKRVAVAATPSIRTCRCGPRYSTGMVFPHSGTWSPEIEEIEVFMPAYLLLLVAVLSRLLPHAGLWNFTAVGGTLLYFGARRSWREMLGPLAVLMACDYFLTVYVYHYGFHTQEYLPTWAWYVAAMALGQILLHSRTTFVRRRCDSSWTDVVLFDFELCGLGQQRDVSAHGWRTGHLLRGRTALLSQRPGVNGDRGCCGFWRPSNGAAAEWGAGTDCAGGEIAVFDPRPCDEKSEGWGIRTYRFNPWID